MFSIDYARLVKIEKFDHHDVSDNQDYWHYWGCGEGFRGRSSDWSLTEHKTRLDQIWFLLSVPTLFNGSRKQSEIVSQINP